MEAVGKNTGTYWNIPGVVAARTKRNVPRLAVEAVVLCYLDGLATFRKHGPVS